MQEGENHLRAVQGCTEYKVLSGSTVIDVDLYRHHSYQLVGQNIAKDDSQSHQSCEENTNHSNGFPDLCHVSETMQLKQHIALADVRRN